MVGVDDGMGVVEGVLLLLALLLLLVVMVAPCCCFLWVVSCLLSKDENDGKEDVLLVLELDVDVSFEDDVVDEDTVFFLSINLLRNVILRQKRSKQVKKKKEKKKLIWRERKNSITTYLNADI